MDKLNHDNIENANDLSGIVRELGDLPDGTIINEEALARLFDRCQVSIKRAIQRRELPPPVKLLGMPVWTVGKILNFINDRLDFAQNEEEKAKKKFESFDI